MRPSLQRPGFASSVRKEKEKDGDGPSLGPRSPKPASAGAGALASPHMDTIPEPIISTTNSPNEKNCIAGTSAGTTGEKPPRAPSRSSTRPSKLAMPSSTASSSAAMSPTTSTMTTTKLVPPTVPTKVPVTAKDAPTVTMDPNHSYTKPTVAFLASMAPPRPQDSNAATAPKWQVAMKVEHKDPPSSASLVSNLPPSTGPMVVAEVTSPQPPQSNSMLLHKPGTPQQQQAAKTNVGSSVPNTQPKSSSAIRAALKSAKIATEQRRKESAALKAEQQQQHQQQMQLENAFSGTCTHCGIYRLKLRELEGEREELYAEVDNLNDEIIALDALLSESGSNLREMHEKYIQEKLESERLRILLAEMSATGTTASDIYGPASTPGSIARRRRSEPVELSLPRNQEGGSSLGFPELDQSLNGALSVVGPLSVGIAFEAEDENPQVRNSYLDHSRSNSLDSIGSGSLLLDMGSDIVRRSQSARRSSNGSSESENVNDNAVGMFSELDELKMRHMNLRRHVDLRNSLSSTTDADEIPNEEEVESYRAESLNNDIANT